MPDKPRHSDNPYQSLAEKPPETIPSTGPGPSVLRVAKWIRRFGYVMLLLWFAWTLIYSQWTGHLFREGREQEAVALLGPFRTAADVLLQIGMAAIFVGVIAAFAKRRRRA